MGFTQKDTTLETTWRSIILLGRNVASYKFSLAETLLDLQSKNSLILLEDMAVPFAKNIVRHLATSDKQITTSSSRFLDSCRKFTSNEISEEQLRIDTMKLGFVNVIDALHNVAGGEVPFRFFDDSRKDKKGITLTDNFYELMQSAQKSNFKFEVDARWRLWETAISLNINPNLLAIKNDIEDNLLFILDDELRRMDVTSSRDALNGYQKGKCFYCQTDIAIEQGLDNSCDVDHFFPHRLKKHGLKDVDGVWNLVLTCKECNRGEQGKFDKIPELGFLYSLNRRNNCYIESHHPLKETIINQTGKTIEKRQEFLQKYFNNACSLIPVQWSPKEFHD